MGEKSPFPLILLLLNDKVFNFCSCAISFGRETIELLSRFNSTSCFRFDISEGMLMMYYPYSKCCESEKIVTGNIFPCDNKNKP